jgi:hypothetical protein
MSVTINVPGGIPLVLRWLGALGAARLALGPERSIAADPLKQRQIL